MAVALATSLADCTNCFLATGLEVLELATRQELQSALVCLAITVAEVKICCWPEAGLQRMAQACLIAWAALKN